MRFPRQQTGHEPAPGAGWLATRDALNARRRAFGLALVAGTLIGTVTLLLQPWLFMPGILLLAALAGLWLWEGWPRRATREGSDSALSGDRAKALLEDFEKSGHGWFWETDEADRIAYMSETLATRMGCTAADLIGTPFGALIADPDCAESLEAQQKLVSHFVKRTAFADISVRAAANGDSRWWTFSGQPVVAEDGTFLGFRGNGSDLTDMRLSRAEVLRLASVDALTGLANRPQMMLALEQALDKRREAIGDCALFLLDLDRFKEVNDTLGHPAGDALLRQVAERLTGIVGETGTVGRIGGDEFKVVLPGNVDMMDLARLADVIIDALSQPYSLGGSQVVIGASIGIALAPADGVDGDTLIRNADLALYAAKDAGRGQFRFFVPAMHVEAEDRRQLESDLRDAIGAGGLHLDYQPVVCASTERVTSFETLVRWEHPARGPISPAVFIPIAEDAGLIGAIGEWVLRTACADATTWPAGIRVAVNVSPIQFANPMLPGIVLSALANSGLPPDQLELEITESVFLADRDNTDGMFARLKALGVRLALDDFGTGYSALGYLKTAPFDKIKIDQSFVRGAAIKGSRNAAIVKTMVSLAEALDMETTAEGAETLDELNLIRALGCSHIQGFVYGRPMSKEAACTFLAEHNGYALPRGHKSGREERMSLQRPVTLHHGSNRYAARMRNISVHGAMVEGLMDVPPGTVFQIEFSPTYRVSGKCRWSTEDRMGIEFEAAISMERANEAENRAEQTETPVKRRARR